MSMNLMRHGTDWLAGQMTRFCSEKVLYQPLTGEGVTVSAVFGATKYEVADEYGTLTGAASIDFLIPASELTITPKLGDRIIVGSDVYEVLEFGGVGCWRWSDPYQFTRRIHTKAVTKGGD